MRSIASTPHFALRNRNMAQTAKDRVRFACDECDQLLSIGTSRNGQ